MQSLFEKYHVYVGQPQPEIISSVAGEMAIFVKLPTEETATFYISTDGTVKDLKDKIIERVGIPAEQLFIIFGCKLLNDPDRKLRDYSIQPESTVYVSLRLRGGAINAYFTNDLDPLWDYNFTNITDKTEFKRGGREYKRPCGWKRYAIKVLNKYGNNDWLGCNGNDKEWPVSYHGTKIDSAVQIVKGMYDINKQEREMHGNGIYSTPDVEYAAKWYSDPFQFEGKTQKVVLQNRVNPSVLKTPEEKIFLVPDGAHIRPYGILIRECN